MADTISSIPSQEQLWPGENSPTRLDVEAANELPEPAFLSNFNKAVLLSQDALGKQDLMHLDIETTGAAPASCTYPITWISDFPTIPSQEQMGHLRQAFLSCYTTHTFLSTLPLAQHPGDLTVPPFRLGVACLGSMQLRRPEKESRSLCLAGLNLWAAMTEIDNKEARSLEMLFGATLLGMYSVMTTDRIIRRRLALLHCGSLTIARRIRLHDPAQVQGSLGLRDLACRDSVLWCLWLTDILYALHLDSGVNGFSSREMWTKMPSSLHQFQDIYRLLIDANDVQLPLPADMTAIDDGVLLLIAVLSDLLCLRRSFSCAFSLPQGSQMQSEKQPSNPFVPLTPPTELGRLQNVLTSALEKWSLQFQSLTAPEVWCFYFYCKLHLSCSEILDLPCLAGYNSLAHAMPATHRNLAISNEAVRMAWLVLDRAAERPKGTALDSLCSIWLPICVFHAALVVWAQESFNNGQRNGERRSKRVLLHGFKIELETMPWPCCHDMAATLERLMDHSPPFGRDPASPGYHAV